MGKKKEKPESGTKIPFFGSLLKSLRKMKDSLPKKRPRFKSLLSLFSRKKGAKIHVTKTESQNRDVDTTADNRSEEELLVEPYKTLRVINWYNNPLLPGNPSSYDDRLTKAIKMRMIFLDDLPAVEKNNRIDSEKREAENIIAAKKMGEIDTKAKRKYYSQYGPKVRKNKEYGLGELRWPLTLPDLEVLENILEGNEIEGDPNPPLTWLVKNNLLKKDKVGKYTIAAPSDNSPFIMHMLTLAAVNTYAVSRYVETTPKKKQKDFEDLKAYLDQIETERDEIKEKKFGDVKGIMLNFLSDFNKEPISAMIRMGRKQKKQNKSLKRAREIRGKLKSSRDYSQARSIYKGYYADDQSHAAQREAARAVLGFMGSANAASGTTHRRERSRRSSKK